MNKSLPRPNRQFGLNLKNTLNDYQIQEKLALKPKSRKKPQTHKYEFPSSRPQLQYFDQVMKYALTTVSYPHILKGPQKVKRDIESLLHQITSINGHNCIWHEDFLNQGGSADSLFMNKQITLEKRTALMDWIINVHRKYTLREETLFLTIKLIDEFAEKNYVPLRRYQLLGITALFMAAKFGEIELPRFKDYVRLVEDQFGPQDMLQMEAEILCKSQFLLSRKISSLWYLEAFAIQQIIFPTHNKSTKTLNIDIQNNNRFTATKQNQQPEQKYQKFMQFARYILNMIQLDYKITLKYKQDIAAIAVLVFTTLNKEFLDTDAKGLMRFFIETKARLVEENERPEEIGKVVKKCMKKVENLYAKRGEKRFDGINAKFQRVAKKF